MSYKNGVISVLGDRRAPLLAGGLSTVELRLAAAPLAGDMPSSFCNPPARILSISFSQSEKSGDSTVLLELSFWVHCASGVSSSGRIVVLREAGVVTPESAFECDNLHR